MARRAREPRRGRQFWEQEIGRFEGSGLRHDEFCRQRGLRLTSFRSWLYRLREEATSTPASPTASLARFVEVVETVPSGSSVGCVLRVGTLELELGSLPSAAYVAELARLVGR
jgi:hypothetical protein